MAHLIQEQISLKINNTYEKLNIVITPLIKHIPKTSLNKSRAAIIQIILETLEEFRKSSKESQQKWILHQELINRSSNINVENIYFSYYKNNLYTQVSVISNSILPLQRDLITEINNAIQRKEQKKYCLKPNSECWLLIKLERDWENNSAKINTYKFQSSFFKRIYLVDDDLTKSFGVKRRV